MELSLIFVVCGGGQGGPLITFVVMLQRSWRFMVSLKFTFLIRVLSQDIGKRWTVYIQLTDPYP